MGWHCASTWDNCIASAVPAEAEPAVWSGAGTERPGQGSSLFTTLKVNLQFWTSYKWIPKVWNASGVQAWKPEPFLCSSPYAVNISFAITCLKPYFSWTNCSAGPNQYLAVRHARYSTNHISASNTNACLPHLYVCSGPTISHLSYIAFSTGSHQQSVWKRKKWKNLRIWEF